MMVFTLSFVGLSLVALVALTKMILTIGVMQQSCPQNGPVARLVSVTVATGFCAIGMGGILLIGAGMQALADAPVVAFMVATGFAVMCLGLGFSNAVNTVRLMLQEPKAAEAA